jgi:hypothetical protein
MRCGLFSLAMFNAAIYYKEYIQYYMVLVVYGCVKFELGHR